MQSCFALNCSMYFYGHSAATSIEQEEQTGIITGLGAYIMANYPAAKDMPPALYESYYRLSKNNLVQFFNTK